jgi:hypothetical protein
VNKRGLGWDSISEDRTTSLRGRQSRRVCPAGAVARLKIVMPLVTHIRDHLRSDHPELADSVANEQIRTWIEVT